MNSLPLQAQPCQRTLNATRPVMTKEQLLALTKRILNMTSTSTTEVTVTHTARSITHIANGRVLSGDMGDSVSIRFKISSSTAGHEEYTTLYTNQLDDTTLHAVVQQAERVDRARMRLADPLWPEQHQVPDPILPVTLWHTSTEHAMTDASTYADVVPTIVDTVARQHVNGKPLEAAAFVGFMARAESVLTKEGITVYNEETDSEATVTARTPDGTSSGWHGQAARDWNTINCGTIAERAATMAVMAANPVAVEPGRRVAILGPAAVAQLMRIFATAFDAAITDQGKTVFSKHPRGSHLGQRVVDARITMRSDPNDPMGGYRPYFERGYATPAVTWINNGVLENLSYDLLYAVQRSKPYSEPPFSIHMSGGPTSIEQMIAQCKEGIYVNRLSDVKQVDMPSGLVTGVTRDGCFLVKDGKISKAVKNFRILESPFFIMNKLEALGEPERAAFGFLSPESSMLNDWPRGDQREWPRRAMIVPPMMVTDFNFSALSDAI